MSLNAALSLVLAEYITAKREAFAGNGVAEFIRNDLPLIVQTMLDKDERYLVKGSAGQGNWASVPWIAIFDRFITESAQDGYYLVYLIKQDCSGVFLSLNQGVTTVRQVYGVGSKTKEALSLRAKDFRSRLGVMDESYETGSIDLGVIDNSNLSKDYEYGSICSKYYPIGAIPTDSQLELDLKAFLVVYNKLATTELQLSGNGLVEDDEASLGTEDLTNLREHKRLERNRQLAQKAKKAHKYTCQACGFQFKKAYRDIGDEFIEAHHLTPLKELRGQKVRLHPKRDFAVLCSNCHRMIHKTEFVSDVAMFRKKYLLTTYNTD
jgi:5-methylcytosine-specific restriction enzyme A